MTEPHPNRGRRRLLVTLAAPFLGLLLAEGLVRVLDVSVPIVPIVEDRLLAPLKDPVLKFVNRPNGIKRVTYEEKGRRWTVEMRLNADRFRGPRVDLEKPVGRKRIACLGDSHTFGEGVPNGATWPDHLRKLVGDDVDVINAGVDAYDTMQEALWYERFVEDWNPDTVILAYFPNDVAARGVGGEVQKDKLAIWTHPRQTGWIRTLRKHSKAADVLCDRIYNRRSLGARQLAWNDRYVDEDPGWQRARRGLIRLRDRCAAEGREFCVALFPYLVEEADVFVSSEALAIVAAFCEQNAIPCFDGEPALLEELARVTKAQDLRVAQSDFHANGRAYGAFSKALAAWLTQTGLLGDS